MKHITLVATGKRLFWRRITNKLWCEGEAQARLLGKYWLRRGMIFHNAYAGPRLRQQEDGADRGRSLSANAGHSFPEIAVMSEFDEYQAEAVMRQRAFHN